MKRFRKSGCYPWCGKDCPVEREDKCPNETDVPKYMAPAPNTMAGSLAMLRYGKRSYTKEKLIYHKQLSSWWNRNKRKKIREPKPSHWRETISPPDRMADIPINCNEKNVELWDLNVVNEIILQSKAICLALHQCYLNKCTDAWIHELANAVFSTLIVEYRGYLSRSRNVDDIPDSDWTPIFESFQSCKTIIAWYLIESYQDDVAFWSARVAQFDARSDDWREIIKETKKKTMFPGLRFVNKKTRKRNEQRKREPKPRSTTGLKFKKKKS